MARLPSSTGFEGLAVWLKDDLRIEDSPAFYHALKSHGHVPLVIISDETAASHVRKTPRRLSHEARAANEIERLVTDAGSKVIRHNGSLTTLMEAVVGQGIAGVHANIQIGDDLSFARDKSIKRALRQQGIEFIEHLYDGFGRAGNKPSSPSIYGARELAPIKFSTAPRAMLNLRTYLKRLPDANYRRDMWTPGPDTRASSRLSIDLACGTLGSDRTVNEITQITQRQDCQNRQAYRQFEARIGWRQSFIQMLEANIAAFPWAPTRHARPEDAPRTRAWLNGETGFPMVDAAIRDLTTNGWVNFRLRQVLLSFALDLLDLDLHLTGVMLGNLFDDYCPGIHWPQVGLQAGMAKGRGPRVINPTKQMRELDTDGAYCRQWLPWLAGVPESLIHEPWKHENYKGPLPVVDYAIAAREARDRHPK